MQPNTGGNLWKWCQSCNGSGIIYKANWIDGYIVSWNYKNNRWKRGYQGGHVALKCLHNSPNLTAKFLREVR